MTKQIGTVRKTKSLSKIYSPKMLLSGAFTSISATNTHQNKYYIPFGGKFVRIRLKYYNDSLTVPMVVDAAWAGVACGRDYTELNPLKPDGSAATWQASTNATTIAVTTDATIPTEGYSDWFTVYVYPDVNNPTYGTLYLRAKSSSGGRSHGFIDAADAANWNAAYPNLKSDARYGSLASIGANLTEGTGTNTEQLYRIAWPDIHTVEHKYTIATFGDSRSNASGDAGDPTRQHWRNIISNANPSIIWQHYAISGNSTSLFLNRCITLLNSSNEKPDAIMVQVSSSNDVNPYTEAQVLANLNLVNQIEDLCRTQGIKLIMIAGYAYYSGNTQDKVDWWTRVNNHAKSSRYYLDFTATPFTIYTGTWPLLNPDYTTDGAHFNAVGHAAAASAMAGKIIKIMED